MFKTNRVLEIVGASENIARIWEVLFEVAKAKSLKYRRVDESFCISEIESKFSDNSLNFVELFCGGGNETILFDSLDSYQKLNRAFSYKILSDYPGMLPMAVQVHVSGDYSDDYSRLMRESDRKKNVMEPQWDMFTVPFAMMDRTTFLPYSCARKIGEKVVRMSRESASKYGCGVKVKKKNEAEIRVFDEMITQKGRESLLAVVHADGNNMGAKIMGMLKGEKDYDKAVEFMRKFTQITSDCFEKKGVDALVKCRDTLMKQYDSLLKKSKVKKSRLSFRTIISSGDEITFVCNARYVMHYVKDYLDAVQTYRNKDLDENIRYSACAGICIFHSHYPFSMAYSMAEQACNEGAKTMVHSTGTMEGGSVEQGWMDFHFVRKGIDGDLEEIRKNQETKERMARPWLVSYDKEDTGAKEVLYKYENMRKLKDIIEKKRNEWGKSDLRGERVSRTAIKTVGSAYERSTSAAKKELTVLYGHHPGLKDDIQKLNPNETDFPNGEKFLKAMYDFAEVYDLWFTEVK